MSQKIKIACLLCRGLITFRNGDKSRFLDHMNNEHDARFDFDVVLVVSLMTEEERKGFVSANKAKLAVLGGNDYIVEDTQMVVPKETEINPVVVVVSDHQRTQDHEMTPDIQNTPDIPNTSDIQNTQDIQKVAGIQKIPETRKSPDFQKTPNERTNSEVEVSETHVEEKPVTKREGVLKCKLCSKYIKQSQLLAHRKTHDDEKNVELPNAEISQSSDEVLKKPSDLENKFDKMMGNTDVANVGRESSNVKKSDENTKSHAKKRKGEESDGEEDWSPKKGKKKQDSDDEDWDASKVKKRNPKSVACAFCKRKFSSKFGLTTHERMVHKEKIVKNPNHVDVSKKEEEKPKSLESQLSQQRTSEVLKRQEGAPQSKRMTRRSTTLEHSLPVSSPGLKSNHEIQPSVINKNSNEDYQKHKVERKLSDVIKDNPLPSRQPTEESSILERVNHDPKERSEVLTDLRPRDVKLPSKTTIGKRSELAVAHLKTKTKLPKNVLVTPLLTLDKEAGVSDESLLADDFDFSEDKPLTIDENVETVTVAVEGSLKHFEFGEISQSDALLLTS